MKPMLVVNYEKRKEMIENYLQENKHLSLGQNFKFLHRSSIMIDRFSKICSCYILYVFLFLCLVILCIFFQTLSTERNWDFSTIWQIFCSTEGSTFCHLERGTLIFCIGDSHANRSTVIISTMKMVKNWN